VRPEISEFLYKGPGTSGETVKGITVFGLAAGVELDRYPSSIPTWRRWRDLWSSHSEICSEFTIPQTIGPSAILYGSLYGESREKK